MTPSETDDHNPEVLKLSEVWAKDLPGAWRSSVILCCDPHHMGSTNRYLACSSQPIHTFQTLTQLSQAFRVSLVIFRSQQQIRFWNSLFICPFQVYYHLPRKKKKKNETSNLQNVYRLSNCYNTHLLPIKPVHNLWVANATMISLQVHCLSLLPSTDCWHTSWI